MAKKQEPRKTETRSGKAAPGGAKHREEGDPAREEKRARAGAVKPGTGRTAGRTLRERSRRIWRKPPAPKLPLEELSRAELLAQAEAKGIKYRTRMSKSELLAALGFAAPAAVPAAPAAAEPVPAAVSAPAAALRNGWNNSWEPHPDHMFIERGASIPENYNKDLVELMIRDPWFLFVYWDLTGGGAGRIPQEGPWVLRVFDIDADQFWDQGIDPSSRNWYLNVEPDTAYRVEIGRIDSKGIFHCVAASRVVYTPRVGESENVEAEWDQPEELRALLQRLMGLAMTAGTPGSPRQVPWSGRGGVPMWSGIFSGQVTSPRPWSWPLPSSWVTSRMAGSWPSSAASGRGGLPFQAQPAVGAPAAAGGPAAPAPNIPVGPPLTPRPAARPGPKRRAPRPRKHNLVRL
jgi:hypothetical protein